MNPLQIALMNLIAKVGLDTAILIAESLSKAETLDDAIAALKTSAQKTWKDYKTEHGTS